MPTAAQIRANQLATQQKAAAAKAAAAKAAAAAKPPVNVANTGGPKPASAPALSVKPPVNVANTGGPKPAPSLNPKPQVDQGYGNGIGYDGKPLYSDIRAGLNAAVGRPNGMVVLDPNYKGPMPTKVPSDTGDGGGIQTATPIPVTPAGKKVFKRGGKVKSKSSYSSGGGVKSSASKRGDGCAQRGKTKGRMI